MTMNRTPATLLGAATAFGLAIGTALASTDAGANAPGYVFPNFWAQAADRQQDTTITPALQPEAATLGIYMTEHRSAGTWLFPPNPWQ